MKFLFTPPEIDAKITEIRAKLRLSMNGEVAQQMTERGIKYKLNYGVSIPRIKEIALNYLPDHDLAQRLWMLRIRETMIMATLLQPVERFTPALASDWIEQLVHGELIEQCCMNLFSKLPYAPGLAIQCVESDGQHWRKMTGYVLAARVYKQFSREQVEHIAQLAVQHAGLGDMQLSQSVALCLSRLARIDKESAAYILKQLEPFGDSLSTQKRYILNEVKQEILFLEIL